MQLTRDDILNAAKRGLERVSGLTVSPLPRSASPIVRPMIAGTVSIRGRCRGVLALRAPYALARSFATRAFKLDPDDVSDAKVREVLGELASLAAETLKSTLGPDIELSPPEILAEADGARLAPDCSICVDASLLVDGLPVHLSLFEHTSTPERFELVTRRSTIPGRACRARVLVVDDSREHLVALQTMLPMFGFEVVAVPSVRRALREVGDCDIALIDHYMPDRSGADGVAELRSHARENVPFLLYTVDAEQAARYRASGFDGVIHRKGNVPALVAQLNAVVLTA